MENLKPIDVAIVGGGWTGLMMAKEITTRTSLTVAVLERGIPRKTSDYALDMDELDYAVCLRMMQNIADETITHRHSMSDTPCRCGNMAHFYPVRAWTVRASTGMEHRGDFFRPFLHYGPT